MSSPEKRFPENLPDQWQKALAEEKDKQYFKELTQFLKTEWKSKQNIFPPRPKILRALQSLDLPEIKVVVLGQDPYHGDGQAIGLSFAVPNELKPKPPSLVNIFKELQSDLQISWNKEDSELTGWVKQGVFLLNTVLTVRRKQAFSHRDKGWEKFTDQIIEHLNRREKGIIFLLWGSAAQKKAELITGSQHYILKSPHPSPLSASRGFFGSKPFSKINSILKNQLGEKPIDWSKINE